MKVSNSMNCLGFAVGAFLFFSAGKVQGQCPNAATPTEFLTCLSSGSVNATATYSVDITGLPLLGKIISVSSGVNLTISITGSPDPAVNTSTVFSIAETGTMTFKSNSGMQTFNNTGISNPNISALNTAITNGSTALFAAVVTAGGPAVLPVTLSSFDAQNLGTSITLQWSTSSELNNAKFELQHRRVSFLAPSWSWRAQVHLLKNTATNSPTIPPVRASTTTASSR
jgi:hypothetical protein